VIPSGYGDAFAREDALDRGAEAAGGVVVEFGRSVDDRPLRAAVVPSSSSQPASSLPTLFVNGNIHGVEWIGARCAQGVLAALGSNRGAALRKRAHVVVAPCLNPDGAFRTQLQRGRGTLHELRGNAHGVDLNRNFPLPGSPGSRRRWSVLSLLGSTGSPDPSSPTYRGVAPFSEPEPRAVEALAARHQFHAVVSFHSFMGTLIPPKVTSSSEAATYRRLCRAWRRGQTHFCSPTVMCAPLDGFIGELEDHLHHVHRAWSLTVEVFPLWRTFGRHPLAPSIFARFNPDDPGPCVDDAVGGCLAFADAALDAPRPG
jgi:hypothetical protein